MDDERHASIPGKSRRRRWAETIVRPLAVSGPPLRQAGRHLREVPQRRLRDLHSMVVANANGCNEDDHRAVLGKGFLDT